MKLEYSVRLGSEATSNVAEYEALSLALKLAKSLGVKYIKIKSDSKLVVNQTQGNYAEKEENLAKDHLQTQIIIGKFDKVEIIQIPREENSEVDNLVKVATASEKGESFKVILTVELKKPSWQEKEEKKNSECGSYRKVGGSNYKILD